MARVWMPRAARTAAAGAFIFALSLTSLGGNAAASPSADEDGQRGCSALAHVRNDAVSNLREAWQGFRKQARDLAHDARELRKEKLDRAALAAAMTELKDANESLDGIRNDARSEMRRIFAATVCGDAKTAAGNPVMTFMQLGERDEDAAGLKLRVQFSEKVSCTGDCAKLFTFGTANLAAGRFKLDEDGNSAKLTFGFDEDTEDENNDESKDEDKDDSSKHLTIKVDRALDKLTFTAGAAGALKDREGNAMATQTVGLLDVSPLAAALAKDLKGVVDAAVTKMQAVTDGLKLSVAAMLTAAGLKARANDEARNNEEKAKAARKLAERAKKLAENAKERTHLDTNKTAKDLPEKAREALKKAQDLANKAKLGEGRTADGKTVNVTDKTENDD